MGFIKFEVTDNDVNIVCDKQSWEGACHEDFSSSLNQIFSFFDSPVDSPQFATGKFIIRKIASDCLQSLNIFKPSETKNEIEEQSTRMAIELLGLSIAEHMGQLGAYLKNSDIDYNNLIYRNQCAEFIRPFGELGRKYSSQIKKLPIEEDKIWQKWRIFFLFQNGVLQFQFWHFLALCLWEHKVKDLWLEENRKLEREQKNKPAIKYDLYLEVSKVLWMPKNKAIETNEGQKWVDSSGNILAGIEPHSLETILEVNRRIGKLSTLTGQKFIRFIFNEIHRRHFSTSYDGDRWTLDIEGGLSRLAGDILGLTKRGHITEIHEIIDAGRMLHFKFKNIYIGGLWTYMYNERRGRGPSSLLSLTLGAAFRPHYMPQERSVLTPITKIPPLVGRSNEHGKQAAFQWAIVGEIVTQRSRVYEEGGALIDLMTLEKIGEQCGLPKNLALKAWNRWLADGDDGLRVFDTIDEKNHLYHVADNEDYGDARAFINETAIRAFKGQSRAKIGNFKKYKKTLSQ